MANLGGFDAREVEPQVGFEPIPADKYLAVVTASQMKETKAGDGHYLELTFQVIEGEYKGRNLWARLNLDNANETAVKIARAELSAVCRAVGEMTPKDSHELHDLPLVVSVKLKKRDDTGEMTNEIKGYEKKEAAEGQPQQATADGCSPSGDVPPWKRS